MSVVLRKLGTLQHVVRARGVRGVVSVVTAKTAPAYQDRRRDAAMLAARLRHGRPRVVLGFHGGIGDDVVCTVLCREFRRRGVGPVWMLSRYPDLFECNDDVAAVLPWDRHYEQSLLRRGWNFLNPRYFRLDRANQRSVLLEPERHMIATMCRVVGIVGPIVRRPYLALSDDERAAGALVPRQVAIQSSGLAAGTPMLNKEWFPARYQDVVRGLRSEFGFVQVGAPTDPPLEGALDLRGRTSRRQTAAILSHSLAFVGNPGFLMHLARAVDCRSVIVYGGRERPDQSGYGCNENLYGDVPCAPCWYRNQCPHDRRCMRQIGAADVVEAVRRVAARHGTPLEVDTDFIEPEPLAEPGPGGLPMMTVTTPFGPRRLEAAILQTAR